MTNRNLLRIIVLIVLSFTSSQLLAQKGYMGKPWKERIQLIPGRIECELYDLGGEGVAYHDSDSINSGSGGLNPANGTYLNEFRIKEAVDISYTKFDDTDNSKFNFVNTIKDQLYIGWTNPNEWTKYTVMVDKTGEYSVGLMFTANGNGTIALDLDGAKLTENLIVPSTNRKEETVDWRQWHHWNKIENLTTVKLEKGGHVITLKTIANGNMNYDYLEFKLK